MNYFFKKIKTWALECNHNNYACHLLITPYFPTQCFSSTFYYYVGIALCVHHHKIKNHSLLASYDYHYTTLEVPVTDQAKEL